MALDRFLSKDYIPNIPFIEGRLPETFWLTERVWRLRTRLVTACSSGLGNPPGRHYDRSAGCLLDGPACVSAPSPGSAGRG